MGGIVAVGKDDASVERGRVESLYETNVEEGASELAGLLSHRDLVAVAGECGALWTV